MARRMELSHDDRGRVPLAEGVFVEFSPARPRRRPAPSGRRPRGRRLIDSPGFSADEADLVLEAIYDRLARARTTVEVLEFSRRALSRPENRPRVGVIKRRATPKECGRPDSHAIRKAREFAKLLERAHEKLRLARGRRAR